MKKQLDAVRIFHTIFKAPAADTQSLITEDRATLRHKLMKEENDEYADACKDNNIVEIADALGDKTYILCGTIIEHGLQHKISRIFDEIQSSNMSKLDQMGNPIFREDGKILKGSNYHKPDIEKILSQPDFSHYEIRHLFEDQLTSMYADNTDSKITDKYIEYVSSYLDLSDEEIANIEKYKNYNITHFNVIENIKGTHAVAYVARVSSPSEDCIADVYFSMEADVEIQAVKFVKSMMTKQCIPKTILEAIKLFS